MVARRRSARGGRTGITVGLEALERRDCPAVVSISGPATVEENGEAVTLTATLSAAQTKPVEVRYFTNGTATAGRDYRLAIGSTNLRVPSGSFTFRPGQTSVAITLTPVNDTTREGTETFRFDLLSARGHTLGTKSVSGTLVDDDSFVASIVGPARVVAGTSTEYTLQLSSPATRMETFFITTLAGTASSLPTADDATPDYFPLTNLPLVFRPGETSKTFRVETAASAADEQDQFFLIQTTPASADFGRLDPFGVTIAGNAPAPVPQVTVADAWATEGNAGKTPLTFTVSLSAPTGLPVTIIYATRDGTATNADRDYEAATGTATIVPGGTSVTVSVNVIGDTKREPDETFFLVVTSATNATIANAAGTGTIWNDETDFFISIVFPDTSISGSQQLAFRAAANRWSQIITADLPDVTINGRTIDDLEITATGPYIDGPSGILGQAGPRATRTSGSQLPYSGIMEFDSADLATMESNGTLQNVILHEMGHVLGIGTLWARKGLLDVTDATNPLYVGANALREYLTLAGSTTATGVPVENTGGSGTAGSHWRESVFDTELMTGYAEPAGVGMPISRITVGSLQDLGYTVSYAAADPYVLPSAIRGWAAVTAVDIAPPRQRFLRYSRIA